VDIKILIKICLSFNLIIFIIQGAKRVKDQKEKEIYFFSFLSIFLSFLSIRAEILRKMKFQFFGDEKKIIEGDPTVI
jgi:hypothetical protein